MVCKIKVQDSEFIVMKNVLEQFKEKNIARNTPHDVTFDIIRQVLVL